MNDWLKVTAVCEPAPQDWSPLIEAFQRHGVTTTVYGSLPTELTGYLETTPQSEAILEGLLEDLKATGAASVTAERTPAEDWAEMWKQFFVPRRVGEHFVVRPTWEDASLEPGDIEIVLDPGQAFGTGDHPTTRVCLCLLERADLAGKTVLDLGCGSGILAIGAVKLGAATVLGTDIDPTSVEISRQNAMLNQVDVPFECCEGMPAGGPWDVIVSNIISATLIRLAARVRESLKPGGAWIASGIIEHNWLDVLAAAEQQGFVLEEVEQEDEWVGAWFRCE